MKQAAGQTAQLSIDPSATSPEAVSDSLNEFFSGWLDSVAPALSKRQSLKTLARPYVYRQRPITTTEIVRVNRATIRESTVLRQWPPDVVAQFLAAEVIRTKQRST